MVTKISFRPTIVIIVLLLLLVACANPQSRTDGKTTAMTIGSPIALIPNATPANTPTVTIERVSTSPSLVKTSPTMAEGRVTPSATWTRLPPPSPAAAMTSPATGSAGQLPSATPTKARQAPPSPSPVPQKPTAEFPRELSLFTAGGGDAPCLYYDGRPLPAIFGGNDHLQDEPRWGVLCIWGMPFDEDLIVDLVSPDSRYSFTRRLQLKRGDNKMVGLSPADFERATMTAVVPPNDIPVALVNLWWPVDLPAGAWKATARSTKTTRTATGVFKSEAHLSPEIGVLVDQLNRNLQTGWDGCHIINSYRSGQPLELSGSGFRPNSEVRLGLYRRRDGALGDFTYGLVTKADNKGQLHATLQPGVLAPGATYKVIALSDSSTISTDQLFTGAHDCFVISAPSVTTGAPSGGTQQACKSSYASRLAKDMRAIVVDPSGLPNRVRARPDKTATQIGKLEQAEEITILDGPTCDGDWTWWRVRSVKTGLEGWTSEGEAKSYWLAPVAAKPPTPTLTPTRLNNATCKSSYPSRLKMGMSARVADPSGQPNRVRSKPDKTASQIGKLEQGEQIQILDGPVCDGDWVWWYVQSTKTGLKGWTSEGEAKAYWLVPVR